MKRVFIILVIGFSGSVTADTATELAQFTANEAWELGLSNLTEIVKLDRRVIDHEIRLLGHETRLNDIQKENARGIAGLAAIKDAQPSAPGRTAAALGAGYYSTESGLGFSIAHKFDTNLNPALSFGVGSAGVNPVYKIGVQVEW